MSSKQILKKIKTNYLLLLPKSSTINVNSPEQVTVLIGGKLDAPLAVEQLLACRKPPIRSAKISYLAQLRLEHHVPEIFIYSVI